MSIIQAAGSGEVSTGFYKLLLDQSLKFDDGLSQRLTRTPASAGNRRTFTFSCWVKRSLTSSGDHVLYSAGADAQNRFQIWIDSSDRLAVYQNTSNSDQIYVYTTAKFRDPSAWYNVVVTVDTTDGTAGNRIVLSVNGTSYAYTSTTTPTQNLDTHMNNTVAHAIGGSSYSAVSLLDGYIAEVNAIDGAALTAASFGETKNGIWIPKDTSGLTFGTNGFHLTFKDDVISEGFNTAIFEGNSTTQSISGLGFSPGLVWVKDRDNGNSHAWSDVVRGRGRNLISNATNAEVSAAAATDKDLISFDADGFSVGQFEDGTYNNNGSSMVAWCWEAGGAPTADNSAGAGATPTSGSVKIDGSNLGSALAGSIAATRISANTARGFSIVTFEGTSTAGSVAHGLSSAPKWVIAKNRDSSTEWPVYHDSVNSGGGSYLRLDSTAANTSSSIIWTDSPSSTVVNIGTYEYVNRDSMVLYCWAEVSGYSKFGSYTGNGSATGPTVTTGFAPAWIMIKSSVGTIGHWNIWDTTRHPSNPNDDRLYANLSNAEDAGGSYDIEVTATGFQIKHTGSDVNTSSATYIYMAFADTREAAFFKDVSSNGNHFTPVNLDYRDSVPDVPTNNFVTLNPLYTFQSGGTNYFSPTLSEGNLRADYSSTSGALFAASTIFVDSGKWYVEVKSIAGFGWVGFSHFTNSSTSAGYALILENGSKDYNGTSVSAVDSVSDGDIIGIAADFDSGTVEFFINNASQTQRDISSFVGVGKFFAFGAYLSGSDNLVHFNFGQDSSFAGLHATANSNADGNGHGSFAYAPPSGFLALCSQNLPDVDIIDGTDNFNTVLYTGDGSTTQNVTVGFDPDFTWIKSRSSGSGHHSLVDSVRGDKALNSNQTIAEYGVGPFNSNANGTIDVPYYANDYSMNTNSATYVAWNWLAGTAFSNDASATGVGTIDSTGQVNTTAGFSIVSYTGTGSAGTIKHGLSAAPEMLIVKNKDTARDWMVYHSALGATKRIWLNYTLAQDSGTAASATWNDTAPTSTVFSIGNNIHINESGDNYICYAFHSVEGYCKVGSYVGNGNADGSFVYTGFRPAWIMVKNYGTTGGWEIHDNKRPGYNPAEKTVDANTTAAESNSNDLDILSNGFKVRNTYGTSNGSANTYIYLAFADQPFKFSNSG